jgi:hypothetical protein
LKNGNSWQTEYLASLTSITFMATGTQSEPAVLSVGIDSHFLTFSPTYYFTPSFKLTTGPSQADLGFLIDSQEMEKGFSTLWIL